MISVCRPSAAKSKPITVSSLATPAFSPKRSSANSRNSSTTDGKDAAKAKALELKGWPYPRHLGGRIFSVIVHGDTEGADSLRHNLHDWLTALDLVPAGAAAVFDRYIGYYEPYATSHDALDRDTAFMKEAQNAATILMQSVTEMRRGRQIPGHDLESPRPK